MKRFLFYCGCLVLLAVFYSCNRNLSRQQLSRVEDKVKFELVVNIYEKVLGIYASSMNFWANEIDSEAESLRESARVGRNAISVFDDVMDAAQLTRIFQVYWNQSGDVESDDADTSNDQTLINTTLNVTMTVADTHLQLNTGAPADARTTATVNVAYTGSGDAPTATLSSSDTNVVTVDQNGNIQAVNVGTAVITARATNPDTGKVATAEVTIQVTDVNAGE